MAVRRVFEAFEGSAPTAGTFMFAERLPFPGRENAFGQAIGPADGGEIEVGAYCLATIVAEAATGASLNFQVEGSIAGVWQTLHTESSSAGFAATISDMAFDRLRVTWSGGAGTHDVRVNVALGA